MRISLALVHGPQIPMFCKEEIQPRIIATDQFCRCSTFHAVLLTNSNLAEQLSRVGEGGTYGVHQKVVIEHHAKFQVCLIFFQQIS